MTKFQRDLQRELKNIEKAIGGSFNAQSMRKIGIESVKIIRRRTKLGYGVANFYQGDKESINQKRQRLKPLSPAYIKQRQRLKKDGKLDSSTAPRKSNLTKTGQMLKKLAVSKVKNGSVILKTSGRRTDGKDNEQVAEWVSDAGRPWLDLTNIEQKQIARFYQNNILKPSLAKV